MKKTILPLLLILIICTACKQTDKQAGNYTTLSPVEFKHTIEKNNTQLLDVRTAAEHAQGHISGSINIDVKQEDFLQKATSTLDKTRTIAIYCRSGRRSKTAAEKLSRAGFKVVELAGGYNAWPAEE